MQQRLRAIGGVPTPFAVPNRGPYMDYRWVTNSRVPSVSRVVTSVFSFDSRQRSATSAGYVQDHQGSHPYGMDSGGGGGGGGGGGSPTYDYTSAGYGAGRSAQQSSAQRRVNSEGELLSSYHRGGGGGDDGVMNYSMPMTGSNYSVSFRHY